MIVYALAGMFLPSLMKMKWILKKPVKYKKAGYRVFTIPGSRKIRLPVTSLPRLPTSKYSKTFIHKGHTKMP
jgi:hypothetical protein